MDVTISRSSLLPLLTRAARVADPRSAMPILSCVLLRAEKGSLTITTSDLALTYSVTLPCAVKTPGVACVSAALTKDIVSRLTGDIRITLEKTTASFRGSGVRTASKLGTYPAEDYPRTEWSDAPDTISRTILASDLAALRRLTGYAQSDDTSRPHLCATLLDMAGSCALAVATDGHRLSAAERTLSETDAKPADLRALIPERSLARMDLPTDDTRLSLTCVRNRRLRIEHTTGDARTTWTTQLVDAAFPSYEQAIPTRWSGSLTLDREALLDAVRAVSAIATTAGGGVRLMPRAESGDVLIEAASVDSCEMSDAVPADFDDAPPKLFGVNATYLSETLAALACERVTLRLSGELDPVRIEGEAGFVGVIMPIRNVG